MKSMKDLKKSEKSLITLQRHLNILELAEQKQLYMQATLDINTVKFMQKNIGTFTKIESILRHTAPQSVAV